MSDNPSESKPIMNLARDVDEFTKAYIECALWSSVNEDGEPLDQYSWTKIHPETLNKMITDCERFQRENDLSGYPSTEAGHDFWLTRNNHGSGFWENDFGTEEQCEKLTESAHAYKEFDLYVGLNSQIYSYQ